MENMLEKAIRAKIRFNYKGLCSVEDLWDLNLEDLDSIFKDVNAELKEQKEESLLDTKTKHKNNLELAVEIIKHIFTVKQQEQKEKESALLRAEKKQKLLGYLADKQDEKYKKMNEEELSKIIDEL